MHGIRVLPEETRQSASDMYKYNAWNRSTESTSTNYDRRFHFLSQLHQPNYGPTAPVINHESSSHEALDTCNRLMNRMAIKQLPLPNFLRPELVNSDLFRFSQLSNAIESIKLEQQRDENKIFNGQFWRNLICPKSPLMVFNELFGRVPIKIQEKYVFNKLLMFTASIQIGDETYTEDGFSREQAQEKVCVHYFRLVLAKKMIELFHNDNATGYDITNEHNKTIGDDDFPWSHFTSMAMHYLIIEWNIQHITQMEAKPSANITPNKDLHVTRNKKESILKTTPWRNITQNEQNPFSPVPLRGFSRVKKLPPNHPSYLKKIILKKLPFNPEFYNPVQLLFELIPRLKIREKRINNSNPLLYEAQCELNGVQFTGCVKH